MTAFLRLHGAALDRGQRAGGSGEFAHQHARAQLVQPVPVPLHGGQQTRHLVAEGDGNGLLKIAAADHRRVAVAPRQIRQTGGEGGQIVLHDRQGLADLKHRRGIRDVLRRGAPVAVFAQLVAAQRVELRDDAKDGIADPFRLLAQFHHVDLVNGAVPDDLVGGFLRDDFQSGLNAGQGRFDVQVFLSAVLIRPYGAHGVGAEDIAEDGGVHDR
jgi:hypothetical protein